MSADPRSAEACRGAEHMLQPYLDRALTEKEVSTVDIHLRECSYCNDRYVFERNLRATVKTCCCQDAAPDGTGRPAAAALLRSGRVVDISRRVEVGAVDRLPVERPARSLAAGRKLTARQRGAAPPGATGLRRSRLPARTGVAARCASRSRATAAASDRGRRPAPPWRRRSRAPARPIRTAATPPGRQLQFGHTHHPALDPARPPRVPGRRGRRAPPPDRQGPRLRPWSTTRSSIARPATGCSCLTPS